MLPASSTLRVMVCVMLGCSFNFVTGIDSVRTFTEQSRQQQKRRQKDQMVKG
jgi:hypothetical protein